MEMARLSSKGQITIPIDIRRKLELHEGDMVIFTEQDGNITITNANLIALEKLQAGFAGEAERIGWVNEQDVVDYCKEIRREMWEERNEHND